MRLQFRRDRAGVQYAADAGDEEEDDDDDDDDDDEEAADDDDEEADGDGDDGDDDDADLAHAHGHRQDNEHGDANKKEDEHESGSVNVHSQRKIHIQAQSNYHKRAYYSSRTHLVFLLGAKVASFSFLFRCCMCLCASTFPSGTNLSTSFLPLLLRDAPPDAAAANGAADDEADSAWRYKQ